MRDKPSLQDLLEVQKHFDLPSPVLVEKDCQTSCAALSQTVNTKSILGASGLANSSQLLLLKPVIGMCAASSCLSASGGTAPDGWLPALYAVNRGSPLTFINPSAMIDRAELPVQRNSTILHVSYREA